MREKRKKHRKMQKIPKGRYKSKICISWGGKKTLQISASPFPFNVYVHAYICTYMFTHKIIARTPQATRLNFNCLQQQIMYLKYFSLFYVNNNRNQAYCVETKAYEYFQIRWIIINLFVCMPLCLTQMPNFANNSILFNYFAK